MRDIDKRAYLEILVLEVAHHNGGSIVAANPVLVLDNEVVPAEIMNRESAR